MPTEIKIMGRVLVRTDKELREVEWIEWDGRAWLAPLWISHDGGKSQRPLRIIAPRIAEGFQAIPGPEMLQFFQKQPIPGSLLDQGYLPSELKPLVEVREDPAIFARNPSE